MAWVRRGISLKWNYSWFHIRFDYQNFIGSFKSKASAWKSIWDSQSLIFKSGKKFELTLSKLTQISFFINSIFPVDIQWNWNTSILCKFGYRFLKLSAISCIQNKNITYSHFCLKLFIALEQLLAKLVLCNYFRKNY